MEIILFLFQKFMIKIINIIDYYKKNIDFSDILKCEKNWDINKEKYKLNSFIIHQSTTKHLRSGHYTTCIRKEEEWIYCNDLNYSFVPKDLFKKKSVDKNYTIQYRMFFFYKRKVFLL